MYRSLKYIPLPALVLLILHASTSAADRVASYTSTTLSITDHDYMTTDTSSSSSGDNNNNNNNSAIDNSIDDYRYDGYPLDYGGEYIYTGFSFERPVYLYIWEILVIFTFLFNIVVISILLRRKMRNETNMILSAIAISDSLTGLVTLPSYIMVYMRYDPATENHHHYEYDSHYYHNDYGYNQYNSNDLYANGTLGSSSNYFVDSNDAYILSEGLCRGFMISKFFLSKSFHAISIFLTLFLGIQRYVSVAFPFKSQSIFTVKKTIFCCLVIFLVSPALHVYHLLKEKAVYGMCEWALSEGGCGHDCAYLWILFFIRHFIPCVALTVFTVLFIRQLHSGTTTLRRMNSNASQVSKRKEENRRISIIVTAIVIVFLIPEIPYGVFLLYSAIDKTVFNGYGLTLERNRAIYMAYELSLLLSFHANFYIYAFLNKKFRKCLCRTFVKPVHRIVGSTRRFSVSSQISSTSRRITRKTECSSSQGAVELRDVQNSISDKSITMETKLKQSVSPDASQSCTVSDNHETDALSANV